MQYWLSITTIPEQDQLIELACMAEACGFHGLTQCLDRKVRRGGRATALACTHGHTQGAVLRLLYRFQFHLAHGDGQTFVF